MIALNHITMQLGARFAYRQTRRSEALIPHLEEELKKRLDPVRVWLEEELHRNKLEIVNVRSCWSNTDHTLGPTFVRLLWRFYWRRG